MLSLISEIKERGLHCPDCSVSVSLALFIQLEVCKCKTPSRLNMKTYSRKAPFEHLQSTDWHLFQTWTHEREIQKEALSKTKTREHPTEEKSGNSRVLVNFPFFFVIDLNAALDCSAQPASELGRTSSSLHFGGRRTGVRICQVSSLHLQRPVRVLYILLFYRPLVQYIAY